ncbi:MAG: hypothetical protein PUB13_07225, partial [Lachnospiraceae bacterium]|nr:hypothetical protein [Lachnospiraceae bacterium]
MRKFNRMLAAILAAALLAGTWVTPLQAEGNNITEEATQEETLPAETVPEETTSEEITTEEFETSEPVTEETGTEELTTEETTEEISEEMTEDSTEASLEDTSVLDYSKENGILRKDLEERLAEAKLALQEEVNQKDIYALIYLADYYAVKDAPSAKAATVAELPSAHTVQIIGMDVDWSTAGDDEYITTLPTVYFEVRFYMGETQATGYVEEKNLAYSDEILLEWKNEYQDIFKLPQASLYSVELYSEAMAADYADVLKFPTSYQGYLNKLKEAHPNWTFVPMNTGRDFSSCV